MKHGTGEEAVGLCARGDQRQARLFLDKVTPEYPQAGFMLSDRWLVSWSQGSATRGLFGR